MIANQLKYEINKKLPFKLNLCYNTSLVQAEKNDENDNKNPIIKLISNFEEITLILNLNDLDYIKFLYFNRLKVHNILYEKEELINIKNEKEDNFIFFIYLSLLIEENLSMLNYTYSSKLINKLNGEQIKIKNEKIKKIILAKIILELITNYEEMTDNDEKNEINLDKIKDFNKKVIKENINDKDIKIFKLTENDILIKRIDEIYSYIIKYFLENQKLDDSDDNTENIFKQIELKSIYLTKVMFDNLSKILNKEEKYLQQYVIKEYDDLFNTNIINFYYTLLRYIIKNNYYIYQIPFLLETRNKIKKIIKSNMNKFYNTINLKKDDKSKIEFFLGAFIEYKYYSKRSLKVIKENEYFSNIASNSSIMNSLDNNRNNNVNYGMYGGDVSYSQSSGYLSGSSYKREREKSGRSLDQFDIEDEEQKPEYEILRESCKKEIAFVILSNSSFKFEFNKDNNNNIVYKCSEIKIDNTIHEINLAQIKTISPENEILKNNYAKFLKIMEQIIEKIKDEISANFSFKITLIFIANEVENSIFHIDCTYKLDIKNENIPEFKDFDILNNGLGEGFSYTINEIKRD